MNRRPARNKRPDVKREGCENEISSSPSSVSIISIQPLKSPIEVLKGLADEFGTRLEYKITECDPGDMDQPIYFECFLSAGAHHVRATSPVKKLAKLTAAHQCLIRMRKYYGKLTIPNWKPVHRMEPLLDSVYLLSKFCRARQLNIPVFSYLKLTSAIAKTTYECKCVWNTVYTEGEGGSKALAQRRAALEMLDYIINQSESKATPSMKYISVDPQMVKAVREGHLPVAALPNIAIPFKVERINQGPEHPTVKVRYGYDPLAVRDGKPLRFSSEYEATFRESGNTPVAAQRLCLNKAAPHANEMFEFMKSVAMRNFQDKRVSRPLALDFQ